MHFIQAKLPESRWVLAIVAAFLPIALWAMLWLSLQTGYLNITNLASPGSLTDIFHGIRAIFPLAAGMMAVLVVLGKLRWHRPYRFWFFSPLGFAAVYGLVGIVAATRSPQLSEALYWSVAYLSVPLVVWAIAWGPDAAGRLRQLININWLIIILGVVALFALALLYLDLGTAILSPSSLLKCDFVPSSGNWTGLTGGILRPTGVGRYAAITAILALGGLGYGRWRYLWIVVFLASLILLLSTGARGSMAGFGAGSLLVVLLWGGKRAVISGVFAALILVPVFWGTGVHRTFLDNCFLQGRVGPASAQTPASPPSNEPVASALPIQGQSSNELIASALPIQGQSSNEPVASALPIQGQPSNEPVASAGPKQGQPSNELIASAGPKQGQPEPDLSSGPGVLLQSQSPVDSAPGASSKLQSGAAGSLKASTSPQVDAKPEALLQVQVTPNTAQDQAVLPFDRRIPEGFFKFTGRTAVWGDGLELFKRSPVLGYGFNADRILLNTHMHNAFMQALIQTGTIGTMFFMGAVLFAWVLLFRVALNMARLPLIHKHLIIQTGGILAFLSVRAIPESTGAFFGVDWFILGPLLLYLQVVNKTQFSEPELPEEPHASGPSFLRLAIGRAWSRVT